MTYQATINRERPLSDVPSEWGIERLDIDAYLTRVGYDGSVEPTVETLQALHRAHLTTIPFENLDILLGCGISLEIDAIQEKLVNNRRGGYCFEHNHLFAAVLERIGFQVARLVARVQPDKPGPRTHMCLIVEADGEEWLADTGFGTTLLEAISLRDGAISQQGKWIYGLTVDEQGHWLLRSMTPEGWSIEYGFTLDPQRPIDYVVYNHYTSTYPSSPFVNQIIALRKTPEVQYALRGRDLSISAPDEPGENREVSDADLASLLEGTFGIVLQADEVAQLVSDERLSQNG